MTLGVLFPRFTFVALMTSLIMPISDFEGLIGLQDRMLVKSGL